MKKCAIATYVFGDDYQSFVPLYIYFFNVEYPEYDIFIYLDKELNDKYKKQLLDLRCRNYQIELVSTIGLGLSEVSLKNNNIARSVRWFLTDERLKRYETIYIGDIDILICHEKVKLYEAHMEHADYLGLPYSNCIRVHKTNRSFKHFLGTVKRYGGNEAIRTRKYFGDECMLLTGLHFIKTKECMPSIELCKQRFVDELNLVGDGKSNIWTRASIIDENVLYELTKQAGLGLPPYDAKNTAVGVKIVENHNPRSVNYRPHHGLHLAIWREKVIDQTVALCGTYQEYYKYFQKQVDTNENLKDIIEQGDSLSSRVIQRMINFYSSV